jgi:hypothetical protein
MSEYEIRVECGKLIEATDHVKTKNHTCKTKRIGGKTDKFNLFCLTAATEGTLLQRTDISTDRMQITQIIPKISLKKPNKESDDQQLIKDAVKRLIDCAIVKDYVKEHAR